MHSKRADVRRSRRAPHHDRTDFLSTSSSSHEGRDRGRLRDNLCRTQARTVSWSVNLRRVHANTLDPASAPILDTIDCTETGVFRCVTWTISGVFRVPVSRWSVWWGATALSGTRHSAVTPPSSCLLEHGSHEAHGSPSVTVHLDSSMCVSISAFACDVCKQPRFQ